MATAPENQNLTFFPGMMFTMAKSTMESTLLWKIVRRMPKGALLHAHLDAMVDFDYLFNLLFEIEGLHLACTSGSLATKEGREEAVIAVKFRNPRPCPLAILRMFLRRSTMPLFGMMTAGASINKASSSL